MRSRTVRPRRTRHPIAGALGALLTVVAFGTIGLVLVEGWPASKALYFTLITITTVGYGDEGISDAGRNFASVLLVVGVMVASFAFARLMEVVVATQLAWRSKMQKRIDKINDHVVIAGYGTTGRMIADELHLAGHAVVVIEIDSEVCDRASEDGVFVVRGSATADEVLRSAGVHRATHLVAAASDETENVVITLSSRDLNPGLHIVARATSGEGRRKLQRVGADRVISPREAGALAMVNAIVRPGVADFVSQASSGQDHGVALAEIAIEEKSELDGVTVADFGRAGGQGISFVSLIRPGAAALMPPRGSDRFAAGDTVIVAGAGEAVLAMGARATAPATTVR